MNKAFIVLAAFLVTSCTVDQDKRNKIFTECLKTSAEVSRYSYDSWDKVVDACDRVAWAQAR